jgi:eukaryotic-like serine/threonine-protein kinase
VSRAAPLAPPASRPVPASIARPAARPAPVPRPSEPEIIEEIEAEEDLPAASAAPIQPVDDDYVDDGPTVLKPSPLLSPLGARPQIAATDSRPVPALTPPPSRRMSPPPSAAKLPPVPKPPSSLSNLMPPSTPSAPAAQLEESPVVTSKLAASLVAPAAPQSARYVPPSVPPPSPRPLSAEETIPISRYNSLSPHALSQLETPPELPMNRPRRGLFLAAAAGILLLFGLGVTAVKAAPALGLGGARTGSLVVTAAGPNGASPTGLRVFADGVVRCEQSPCTIPDLGVGTHFVSVDAAGFTPTAARAVSVEKSVEATLNVELTPKEAPQAAAAPKTEPAATSLSDLRPETQPEPATQSTKTETSHAATTAHASLARSAKVSSSKPAKATKASSAQAAGDATLNINSIPMSSVVLDGRPVGSTPLVGVHVSPGSHSVVFINPEKGRKASGATVKAGGSATVAVRF